MRIVVWFSALLLLGSLTGASSARQGASPPSKTALPTSGLVLQRSTHPGAFYGVTGRRSAVFGYEHRGFEAWTYPLQILDEFRLSFALEGYPLPVAAEDLLATVTV